MNFSVLEHHLHQNILGNGGVCLLSRNSFFHTELNQALFLSVHATFVADMLVPHSSFIQREIAPFTADLAIW